MNYASNSRKLIGWNGQQQATYVYHAHVSIAAGLNVTTSHRAYGTWAADDQ